MMLEELQRRNYSAITTRNYLRVVTEFAKYFGKSPDKLGPNELRTYQAYLLTECKLTPGTVVNPNPFRDSIPNRAGLPDAPSPAAPGPTGCASALRDRKSTR